MKSPCVRFGEEDMDGFDWRADESEFDLDDDDDDDLLAETPSDVIEMLGFDPLDDAGS